MVNYILDRKEKLIGSLINLISEMDYKASDEVENNLYKIIREIRGLIHENLKWPENDLDANSLYEIQ